MQTHDFISVKFPHSADILYAEVKQVNPDGSFDCRFVHTGSHYTFRNSNGQLEVLKSTGMYKPGTITTEVNFFELTDKWTKSPGGFAAVTFNDGLSYLGIVESYTPELKLKFLHSGSAYTFDSSGVAHTSSGKYNGQSTTAIQPYTLLFIAGSSVSAPPLPSPAGTIPSATPNAEASDIDTASIHINNFRKPKASAWKFLDRDKVADGLLQLANDPESIQQAGLSLCGPAAFIAIYAKYNPIDFVLFSIGLFNDGMGTINHLLLQPNDDLLNADYAAINRTDPNMPNMAQWMVLSTLADDNNTILDYEGTPGEKLEGFTYPKSLKRWLDNVGRFTSVENNTNTINRMSYKEIIDKSKTGNPIILLINHSMLKEGEIKGFPPDHYIILKSAIMMTGSDLEFSYWSWGQTKNLKIWSLDFDNSFFGYIMATI